MIRPAENGRKKIDGTRRLLEAERSVRTMRDAISLPHLVKPSLGLSTRFVGKERGPLGVLEMDG